MIRLSCNLQSHDLEEAGEVVDLEVPGEPPHEENPWLRLHGAFQNDPSFDEWQAVIHENWKVEDEADGIYPERNPQPLP